MILTLKLEFHTDGDFTFDNIDTLFNPTHPLYKEADISYRYTVDDEIIYMDLIATGDAYACQYAARDLLEHLVCNIRTHKYHLVRDICNLLIPIREDHLFCEGDITCRQSMSGNYYGTFACLKTQC